MVHRLELCSGFRRSFRPSSVLWPPVRLDSLVPRHVPPDQIKAPRIKIGMQKSRGGLDTAGASAQRPVAARRADAASTGTEIRHGRNLDSRTSPAIDTFAFRPNRLMGRSPPGLGVECGVTVAPKALTRPCRRALTGLVDSDAWSTPRPPNRADAVGGVYADLYRSRPNTDRELTMHECVKLPGAGRGELGARAVPTGPLIMWRWRSVDPERSLQSVRSTQTAEREGRDLPGVLPTAISLLTLASAAAAIFKWGKLGEIIGHDTTARGTMQRAAPA